MAENRAQSALAASESLPSEDLPPVQQCRSAWIEIVLVDADGVPVGGEPYQVTTAAREVIEGALDGNGFAHIGPIAPGTCKITFPRRDREIWEPA